MKTIIQIICKTFGNCLIKVVLLALNTIKSFFDFKKSQIDYKKDKEKEKKEKEYQENADNVVDNGDINDLLDLKRKK